MKKLQILMLFFTGFLFANDISGVYAVIANGDESYVEVFQKNKKYYAVGFANKSGKSGGNDVKNPNEKLRNRPIQGAVFLWGLSFKKDKEYTGGKLYNFSNGMQYYVSVKQQENGIKLRISKDASGLFGKSVEWRKLNDKEIAPYANKRLNVDNLQLPN